MEKITEYHLISHAGDSKIKAKLWWDGEEIQSDTPSFLNQVKNIRVGSLSYKDGLDFLQVLPMHFRSGYLVLKKVK